MIVFRLDLIDRLWRLVPLSVLQSAPMAIEKERTAWSKLTREIVYEKKAADSEGMGRFAHKLRQFYEFYLIASFLFLKSPQVIFKKWEDEWITQPTCILSKNFLPRPDKNKTKEILKLSRGQMRMLIGVITGQNNLNYVQSKIDPLHIEPECRFCLEEDETFEHLINECPCFMTYRRENLMGNFFKNTLDWKPKQLLDFANHEGIFQALDTYQEVSNS